jgi:FkbM family methyltransferase
MDFSKPSRARSLGLYIARPLSRILTQPGIYKRVWLMDVYFNFLIGKGAGTGWDMKDEIEAATGIIHRRNPTVLDIGANVGKWSKMLLAKLPEARVFQCEPSPTSQAEIRKLNLPNSTLLPYAVGERAEKAVLYTSRDCDGSASLHARVDTYFSTRSYQAINVETITIDEIAESNQLDFIDFIKMDIEGHELFALRGAQKCLANRRIGALLFEFGFGNINSRTFFKDFWDLLSPDFRIYRVTPSGKPLVLEEYYEDLEYFRGATNYIAELKSHPLKTTGK